jgi:hypothetical protein
MPNYSPTKEPPNSTPSPITYTSRDRINTSSSSNSYKYSLCD